MLNQNLLLGDAGYNLTNSLRFRSSASAYLNRTPASAGNRKTWTWSGWVKRSNISSNGVLFAARTGSDATYFNLSFQSAGDLRIESNSETAYPLYKTNALFRDPSAWYHIVMTLDMTQATSTDRVKVYVNNVLQTTASYNVPAQNTDLNVNNTVTHLIGQQASGNYFDGYLTEVNFIDGQALTPSSFGQTDPATGVWQPKKYSGTYGTNGFYLPFTDNSALTTSSNAGLGKDFSGNSNYWTTNNISITSGSTYDSMTDVPTLTSASAANYAVLNPIATNTIGVATLSNANLNFSIPNTFTAISTMSASSGKYYWEAVATSSPIGIGLKQVNVLDRYSNSIYYMGSSLSASGEKYVNGTGSAYGASWTTNDVIGVAVDMDAGTVTFYKNNVSQGSIALSLATITEFVPSFVSGAGATFVGFVNFGQRPFAYTPPTGFVALNTFNLPTPTIGATASTQANDYFDVSLWTGNGTSQSITNSGSFQPDFVWLKYRNSGTNSHNLYDVIRGATKYLFSNSTAAEGTNAQALTAFNSNGFSVGNDNDVNQSSGTYVGWQWKANGTGVTNTAGTITSTVSANTTAGFSIVTYTGNGTAGATVGHGLGVAPKMMIAKNRTTAGTNWVTYHSSMPSSPANVMYLNLTLGSVVDAAFNSANPTSTVFSIGNRADTNTSGASQLVYCFSEVAGYSAFGSYTGNGSSDGPFVFTGFRPRWVMMKCSSATADWVILDTARDTYNVETNALFPSASDADSSGYLLDGLSNGFKIRNSFSSQNSSGATYIYAAFAEYPFKYANAR